MRLRPVTLATAITVVFSLLLQPTISNAAYIDFESLGGISVVEGADGSGTVVSLIKAKNDASGSETPCYGISDPNCLGKELRAGVFLLPCSEQNSIGCTVEVYAISITGEKLPA